MGDMKKSRKTGRNPHKRQLMIDLAHIVIGSAAVAIAVFAFVDLDNRMIWFPFVFALAALLNFINGIPRLGGTFRRNPQLKAGIFLVIVGVALLAFAAGSAYTLWR
ncbi:MAG: hypothetical protein IJZ85_13670 [Lachnospiraceae bacterium]|nr:hypothetical protein [Lachnospiraceae bacterium]